MKNCKYCKFGDIKKYDPITGVYDIWCIGNEFITNETSVCNKFELNKNALFLISNNNEIIGNYNNDRLKSLPFYKRLYALINKNYKNKFIDIKPFEIEYIK